MVTQNQNHANEAYGCPYVEEPVLVPTQLHGDRGAVEGLCYPSAISVLLLKSEYVSSAAPAFFSFRSVMKVSKI